MTDGPKDRPNPSSAIILYQTEDGRNRIEVRLESETVWLTQKMMAELFQKDVRTINEHILNMFSEKEVPQESVIREYRITAEDGKSYLTKHYNLDVIISVGYRVKSQRGTQFRIWATQRLREYIVKGFTLDDERLKGRDKLADYFDELLARIREIRASEKRAYQRIREIFALASDYQEGEQETQAFFATMQNKMHFAATGMTAAEIVRRRADSTQTNMGLMAWSGGRVLKRDVPTAKNYLGEHEIDTLNRIVVMFLDQAEFRAQRRQDIKMRDWTGFLDKFLRDTELPVLEGAGSVSQEDARAWAEAQYDAFAERRRLQAEQVAEKQYIEDLKSAAKTLEAARKKPSAKRKGGKL
jgi:hypothetical protein